MKKLKKIFLTGFSLMIMGVTALAHDFEKDWNSVTQEYNTNESYCESIYWEDEDNCKYVDGEHYWEEEIADKKAQNELSTAFCASLHESAHKDCLKSLKEQNEKINR